MKPTALLSFSLLFLFFSQSFAQKKPKKIEQIHSDLIERKPDLFEGNLVFTGSVKFRHEGSILTADTVILNQDTNSLVARSNVKMNMSDTVTLSCKILDYDGNTKKAFARKNVRLKDRSQTLTSEELEFDRNTNIVFARDNVVFKDASQTLYTEELIYNRNQQKAFYNTRSKIIQQGNVMYSNYGVYDLRTRSMKFESNVDIATKEYDINSDDITFFNNQGKALVNGPTTITERANPNNYIYTEEGEYYTNRKEAYLRKNSKIVSNGKTLTGDLMYFNQNTGFGKANGNVVLIDPKEKTTLKGGYGEYFQAKDSTMVTKQPYIIKAFKRDSLYISADTLIAKRNKEKQSKIYGFHKVRMFKPDVQAKCDSILYEESKGEMHFYKDPVFWNTYRQITGDTIVAYSDVIKQQLDSVNVYGNAFAISKADSLSVSDFNQVKGRNMHALVANQELRYINVKGNAESIVFVDDQDQKTKKKTRIGINKSVCGIIESDFYAQQVNIIECAINGEGKLYPEEMIDPKDRYLKNFVWRDKERPRKWHDIFLDIPNTLSSEFSPTQSSSTELSNGVRKGPIKPKKIDKPNELKDFQDNR